MKNELEKTQFRNPFGDKMTVPIAVNMETERLIEIDLSSSLLAVQRFFGDNFLESLILGISTCYSKEDVELWAFSFGLPDAQKYERCSVPHLSRLGWTHSQVTHQKLSKAVFDALKAAYMRRKRRIKKDIFEYESKRRCYQKKFPHLLVFLEDFELFFRHLDMKERSLFTDMLLEGKRIGMHFVMVSKNGVSVLKAEELDCFSAKLLWRSGVERKETEAFLGRFAAEGDFGREMFERLGMFDMICVQAGGIYHAGLLFSEEEYLK